MSNETTTTTSDSRIRVGDVVRVVVGPQVGYGQLGNVVSVGDAIEVNFPDGAVQQGYDEVFTFNLFYGESELEKVSVS